MLRALWYIFKIFILIGLSIYLLTQQGDVAISWRDYNISVPLGYAAVGLLVLLFGISFLSEFTTRLSLWPSQIRRSQAEKRRSKGYRALIQSMSAAAIGDSKNALTLAQRAQKFLPEAESGLPLLLQAQALSKQQGTVSIDEPYQLLLKNSDTVLLGLQGLTQNAILTGDFEKALVLARKSYADNPKSEILAKAIYDLELKNHLWNDALATLDKHKKLFQENFTADKATLFLMLGDMAVEAGRKDEAFAFYKNAYKLDSSFVPAAMRYIRALIENGQRNKALSLLKKAWKVEGHPAFLPLWTALMPEQKAGQPNVKFRWFQWIAEFHPQSEIAQLALARAAIDEQLWGDARVALAQAEKFGRSESIYKLWIELEEKTTHQADVIAQWRDRAAQARTDGVWICTKTGRVFAEWQALILPENVFNTLVWVGEGKDKSTMMTVAVKSA